MATRMGGDDATLSGRYRNIFALLGLLPNPVTSWSDAAAHGCAASSTAASCKDAVATDLCCIMILTRYSLVSRVASPARLAKLKLPSRQTLRRDWGVGTSSEETTGRRKRGSAVGLRPAKLAR